MEFKTNFEKGTFYLGALLGYYLEKGEKKGWYFKLMSQKVGKLSPDHIKAIFPRLYYALLDEGLDTEPARRVFAQASEYFARSSKEDERQSEMIAFALGLGQGLWEKVFRGEEIV